MRIPTFDGCKVKRLCHSEHIKTAISKIREITDNYPADRIATDSHIQSTLEYYIFDFLKRYHHLCRDIAETRHRCNFCGSAWTLFRNMLSFVRETTVGSFGTQVYMDILEATRISIESGFFD